MTPSPQKVASSSAPPSSFFAFLSRFLFFQGAADAEIRKRLFVGDQEDLWIRFLAKVFVQHSARFESFAPRIELRSWWNDVRPAYRHFSPCSLEVEWRPLGLRLKQTRVFFPVREGDYSEATSTGELEIWHEHKNTRLLGYVRGDQAIEELFRSLVENTACPSGLERERNLLHDLTPGVLEGLPDIPCTCHLKRPFFPRYFFEPAKPPSATPSLPSVFPVLPPSPRPETPRWLVGVASERPLPDPDHEKAAAFPASEIARIRAVTSSRTAVVLKNGQEWFLLLSLEECLSQLGL